MKFTFSKAAFLLLISLGITPLFAQFKEERLLLFDASYGFPDKFRDLVGNYYFREHFQDVPFNDYSIGPIEFRGEYKLSKKIGVGLMVNHTISVFTLSTDLFSTPEIVEYTSNGFPVKEVFEYDYFFKIKRTRVMPRINYHVANSNNVEAFGSLALGYIHYAASLSTDNPRFNITLPVTAEEQPPPFSARISFGLRVRLINSIGVMGEMGFFGGPLLNVGFYTYTLRKYRED